VAVVGAFRSSAVGRADLLAADEELASAARGEGADAAPPASADELRALAQVWAAYLDQDGAEPAESRSMRRRGFTIGRPGEDGLVPVRGNLLPEVAAQLQLGFDSVLNPKGGGAAPPPRRGRALWRREATRRPVTPPRENMQRVWDGRVVRRLPDSSVKHGTLPSSLLPSSLLPVPLVTGSAPLGPQTNSSPVISRGG
jgi:hypothetical protein